MLTSFTVLASFIYCLFVSVSGQYASTYPAPIPLINKSPYLNIWIASDDSLTTPGGRWPVFYSGPNVSWTGNIRVDGSGYIFQGVNSNYTTAKTVGAYITPTRTIFTIDAGPVRLNLTYLNPIEMGDLRLHSFPFGYLAINLWSTDGQPHSVQLYSDVSGEFVSSDVSNAIVWNTTQTPRIIYHQMRRSAIDSLAENKDMSEDGVLYFATPAASNLTWQTSAFNASRYAFLMNGTLTNTTDTKYRAISDNWPVMSFALDLGNVTSTPAQTVFALGLVRDPVLTYLRNDNVVQNRSALWWLTWNSVESAMDNFLADYPAALSRAVTLDNRIMSDVANLSLPANISAAYRDLLALNLRQTLGAIELTTSKLSNGKWAGISDMRAFMKDVGNSRRVTPVEVLYAAFPALLYINTELAFSLLQPLLEFQSSWALYQKGYAAPDLGANWPHIQGNNTDQVAYSVDNCGSMLVMALAYAQKSGGGWLIHHYYGLFRKWADYLVTNALQPIGFLGLDNIPETSNLALKGIMGIYAMGRINKALEVRGADPAKTTYYLDTASNYARQWESLALSNDHVASAYGNPATWGLLYNLYAPRLLGAGIISEKIYEVQAAWYASKVSSVDTFGFAYDTAEPLVAKAHWTLLTAGSVYNASLSSARDALITMAQARPYFKNPTNRPNPSTYKMDMGTTITGVSSPALGASFALLALSLSDHAVLTIPNDPLTESGGNGSSNKVPSIVGGSVGGVLGLAAICVGIVIFLRRRAKKNEEAWKAENASLSEPPPETATTITPFRSKSALMMEEMGQVAISPSSDSTRSSGVGGTAMAGESSMPRLVPQRPAYLHVTNHSPTTDGKPLPSPLRSSGRDTERPQTQDDGLRREVEQLRVEMDALRGQQIQQASMPEEPPPGYSTLLRQSQQQ